MAIDPFISVLVYVVVAAYIMTVVMFRTSDIEDRFFGATVAMSWPVVVVVTAMFLPVWVGVGIFYAVQAMKHKANRHDH